MSMYSSVKNSHSYLLIIIKSFNYLITMIFYYFCFMRSLKISIIALSTLLSGMAFGQYNFDFGVKLGGSNYLGDIGGKEKTARRFVFDMKLEQTNLVGGIYARYKFNGYYGLNVAFNYGRVSGDDMLSENPGRNNRNLRFKNDIMELAIQNELYIFELNDVGGHGRYWVDMKGYIFAGVTALHHNPKGQIMGQSDWVNLQPLETEGVHYSKWAVGIPAGLGIYFTYKRKHRIGWDVSWTTTFTDYLDDISTVYADPATFDNQLTADIANQSSLVPGITDADLANYAPPSESNSGRRGDPEYNDTYMFTTFSYGYLLRTKNSFYTQNYGRLKGRKKSVRRVRAKF